ncbi:MAG: 4-hydroxythreonine-4-phosphate dehydrogenase PdxA [Nitrospirota bacterium]|nr:4-hydroxythreonine-4-phosphate dehydrogenase PdxA [Nitrospirota bacterium]
MTTLHRIAITMGDPAGIGPEIISRVFQSGDAHAFCRPFVVGNRMVLEKVVAEQKFGLAVRTISSPAESSPEKGVLEVLNIGAIAPADHVWGRPVPAMGTSVVEYIRTATDLALRGEIAAIVTAPLNKELIHAAGHDFPGHTELLAHLTGSRRYGMLFVGGGLNLILATIHHRLRDVPELITKERVLTTIQLAHEAMQSFGIQKPRIGVAALNPHAGEAGLFGTEETQEILPAVLAARSEGIDASDPLPADTLFHKARKGMYDIVVAMYHDQGLAPLKMIAFGNAVNITVGLPIIRTSVDHGTAYDIAGKGRADPASLFEAIRLAAVMADHRTAAGKGRP